MSNKYYISNFEEKAKITNDLIAKVQELSNPVKVEKWLKHICIWQQIEIELLNKRLYELESNYSKDKS